MKPKHILGSIDDEDEDIECSSLLSRYAERDKEIEAVTLAGFVSMYKRVTSKCIPRNDKQTKENVENLLPEPNECKNEHIDEQDESSLHQEIVSKTVKYRKRTKGHIIRSVYFNPDV